MARRPSLIVRRIKLQRVRKAAERDISKVAHQQFNSLWKQIYPSIRDLKKEHKTKEGGWMDPNVWHTWFRTFTDALDSAIGDWVQPIAGTERTFWQAYGMDVGNIGDDVVYSPAAVLNAYHNKAGYHIKDISDTTREKMADIINNWYMGDKGIDDLVTSLGYWFSGSRAETIAVTEVTSLCSQVAWDMGRQIGVDRWTAQDTEDGLVCTTSPIELEGHTYQGCLDVNGRSFNFDTPMPPFHVGCRCGVTLLPNYAAGEEE